MAATPAANVGVGSWIERRARVSPDRVALIGNGRSLTYAELAGRIRRLANGLLRLGVERGDRVGWIGPNHPAYLESLFSCGLVGAALAPVNHQFAASQVRAALDETAPTVLIQHDAADAVSTPASVRHRIALAGSADTALDFETLMAESPDAALDVPVEMDDICLLPHTSGTTGSPKAIALTHANVTWNVVNLLTCADLRGDDVTVAIAPFFRVGGTGVNVLPVLFLGGTVVVPEGTSPEAILLAMQRHQVTVGFGNPDLLDALTRATAWPLVDLSSVRFMLTGGAPVPERLIRQYLDRGVTLLQGYGLSEAAPLALLLDPASSLTKIGSAGKPPLLVDIQIAAADGTVVGAGEIGELLVRGPNVMAGYWNRPEATREAITPTGWLRTGDAARVDEQGYVWIVDRIADQFFSVGEPVYPAEVERVLIGHPSIADAGVTQVVSGDGRQLVVAVVVPVAGSTATEEELLAFGRQRLASHQAPSSVTFVDHLPRSTVGKLVRAQLQALATESLDR
ncbi:fatty-acyl-CoA synthase [Hamadaea flava]|uniref:AMP-binding protein n=1 Tax=Hamadaea flava TaxID=1742688 RepID=A0ABV8M3S2_9ACTN|nr:AMP-binding protein [Hamadaea flava]MCP2326901.1 fatty-acyl-CoA synthase [Hamadaea flava]